MRRILRATVESCRHDMVQQGVDPDTLSIPNIVHSTYLRFAQVPQTSGEVVQRRFEERVQPLANTVFGKSSPVRLPDTKLVDEYVAYMHSPTMDDKSVLERCRFTS